jgi:dTDP-4-dehydrorhamnose 3,5-epimerase
MKFTETPLPGGYLVELEKRCDDRGYFARVWCAEEFAAHGLDPRVCQFNAGFSHRPGTLRGMHFQLPPFAEVKLIRCTRGAVYDVMVDLREDSPTCGQYFGAELTPENGRMLYVPEGFAHGYQTLVADSELVYQTTQPYQAAAASGIRYDDPVLNIPWPLPVSCISAQDQRWPGYVPSAPPFRATVTQGGAV